MPARDAIHDAVRNALIKDGWTITNDPCLLKHGELIVYPDLGVDRSLAVERDHERLIVEIKSFRDRSSVFQLEHAIGQYEVYRILLNKLEPESNLYLAVTNDVYKRVFQKKGVDLIVETLSIRILTIDPNLEEITQWIR